MSLSGKDFKAKNDSIIINFKVHKKAFRDELEAYIDRFYPLSDEAEERKLIEILNLLNSLKDGRA